MYILSDIIFVMEYSLVHSFNGHLCLIYFQALRSTAVVAFSMDLRSHKIIFKLILDTFSFE